MARASAANYAVVEDSADFLVIRDVGPWDEHLTITNDAEGVVARVAPELKGRRLLYYDSQDDLDELLVRDGRFAGFRPGPVRSPGETR